MSVIPSYICHKPRIMYADSQYKCQLEAALNSPWSWSPGLRQSLPSCLAHLLLLAGKSSVTAWISVQPDTAADVISSHCQEHCSSGLWTCFHYIVLATCSWLTDCSCFHCAGYNHNNNDHCFCCYEAPGPVSLLIRSSSPSPFTGTSVKHETTWQRHMINTLSSFH